MADYDPAPRGMLTQREWRASQIARVTAIVMLTGLAILGIPGAALDADQADDEAAA